MKTTAIAAAAFSLTLGLSAAYAGTQEDMAACLAEIEASSTADDYRAKFKGVRGGGMKTMTFKLTSISGGDDAVAVCKVKRGKVVDVSIKA